MQLIMKPHITSLSDASSDRRRGSGFINLADVLHALQSYGIRRVSYWRACISVYEDGPQICTIRGITRISQFLGVLAQGLLLSSTCFCKPQASVVSLWPLFLATI